MAEAPTDHAPRVGPAVAHPLEALTADEIRAAVSAVRSDGRLDEHARFAAVTLEPPSKEVVAAHRPGEPVGRRVRLVIVPGRHSAVIEAIVDVGSGEVLSWDERQGVRPALLFDEPSLHHRPAGRPGVADGDATAGHHRLRHRSRSTRGRPATSGWRIEEGRRITRCLAYYRENPDDNGYAHPVEGLIAFVDMARGEVLEVVDHGVVPLPPETGSYCPEDHGPLRADLRPARDRPARGPELHRRGQPASVAEVVAARVDGPDEGLVLHAVGYDDGGRVRPILHRASITEMVVPYGDPGPMHGWKNAFDAGEWGLGRMANSLDLGCDCLGEIHYLDAVFANETRPALRGRERDLHPRGGLRHPLEAQTCTAGRTEVRRSRRLVISSISTVGNYEYGFYWYFYLDGTIQLEVKLTGILSTMAVAPGRAPARFASMVAPELAAPFHQHLFNARLDLEVDGPRNSVYEVDVESPTRRARTTRGPTPSRPVSPLGPTSRRPSGWSTRPQPDLEVRQPRGAQRAWASPWPTSSSPGRRRPCWPTRTRASARRAGFATPQPVGDAVRPDERRAAGDHPNQHPGGDGLPALDRGRPPLVDTDSWSGTRSGSPTSPAPRTGRSCRSSTPGSAHPGRLLRSQPGARRPAAAGLPLSSRRPGAAGPNCRSGLVRPSSSGQRRRRWLAWPPSHTSFCLARLKRKWASFAQVKPTPRGAGCPHRSP